jgi:amidase
MASSTMSHDFDPDFGTALDASAAIRAKKISSVELTQHTFRRIDAFQPTLNAYVYQLRDEALAEARRADDAITRHAATGALHGVPVNVKESFGVEGQPCTWGMPPLKGCRAPAHSVAVRRLLDAGAILLGATNVPLELNDVQAFNDIYGTTSNPWDLARTPGGSSGGTAAALAAGMAFFGIGSDIGGSIRAPAAFCGIYGHKPTLDLVNLTGHAPGGAYAPLGFSTLLAVADRWHGAPMILRQDCACWPGRSLRTRRPFGGRSQPHVTRPCVISASATCWKIQPYRYPRTPGPCSKRGYAPANVPAPR